MQTLFKRLDVCVGTILTYSNAMLNCIHRVLGHIGNSKLCDVSSNKHHSTNALSRHTYTTQILRWPSNMNKHRVTTPKTSTLWRWVDSAWHLKHPLSLMRRSLAGVQLINSTPHGCGGEHRHTPTNTAKKHTNTI